MKPLQRREFLMFSALAGAACLTAACKAPIPAIPSAQPGGARLPIPLDTGTLDADSVASIEKLMAYAMEQNKVPGMAIGVVEEGKLVFAKGYGVAKNGEKRVVTPQTLFRVMDLTHLFTAAAAVQLAEADKLDLDAPIIEVLPYFQLQDQRYKQITTRHLLSESAGLPATREDVPFKDWVDKTPQYDEGALERYVRSLSDGVLNNDPGVSRQFSNMSFDIAGDVIAKASGEAFEDYMQTHILTPLGMTQSTFFPQKAAPDLRASPHVVEGPDLVVSDLLTYSRERAPSVGLLSNVDDLTRWIMADLNRGTLHGSRILPSSAYDQLWKPTVELGGGSEFEDMGLGWFLGTNSGNPVYQYWGNDVGFHAATYLAPEQKTGVVVLGNQFTGTNSTEWYAYTIASLVVPWIAFR